MAWWANLQIDALKQARELWAKTLLQADPSTALGMRQSRQTLDPPNAAARNTVGRVSP